MSTTIKLRAPNPDMNGVRIDGYDRVERKSDGLFHVHDSNLAAKLQARPHFFKVVKDEPAAKKPEPKPVEDKKLEDMTREELVAWLAERGVVDVKDDDTLELLLDVAKVKQADADKKSNSKKK